MSYRNGRVGHSNDRDYKLQSQEAVWGAGEMAQWLRALTAPPEDPGSIPSTHMAARSCL